MQKILNITSLQIPLLVAGKFRQAVSGSNRHPEAGGIQPMLGEEKKTNEYDAVSGPPNTWVRAMR